MLFAFKNYINKKTACSYKCYSCESLNNNCIECFLNSNRIDYPFCYCDDGFFEDSSALNKSICLGIKNQTEKNKIYKYFILFNFPY
jgi:hypothetical protein